MDGCSREIHRCHETVSLPGNCLDETGLFGIVFQNGSNFSDRTVNAVVRIEEDLLPPDPLRNLLAADKLTPLLDQEQQNFHRDALKFEHTTAPTQRVGLCVELEILCKPDGF